MATRYLLVFLSAILVSGCNDGPTPGSHVVEHAKEFAALTDWMEQHGFKTRQTAAWVEQKGDSNYLAKDYQWYEGSYNGSPSFFVLIKIGASNQIEIIEGRSGQATSAMNQLHRDIQQFYGTLR